MKKAFSLIELLISLIVISVIAASFAPVISKKINNAQLGISANKVKTDCPVDPYGQNCKLCDATSCLVTTQEAEETTCPSGEYSSGSACIPCPAGNYCTNNTKILCGNLKYQDEMGKSTCKDCIGTGTNSAHTKCCKYGTVVKNGECYDPCKAVGLINSFFIPTISATNGICMTKYNAGDDDEFVVMHINKNLNDHNIYKIVKPMASVSINKNYTKNSASEGNYESTKVCWHSSNGDYPISSGGRYYDRSMKQLLPGYSEYSYNYRRRTLCTWTAAKALCGKGKFSRGTSYSWRLPTKAELEYLKNNIKQNPYNSTTFEHDHITSGLGSDGLELARHGNYLICKGSKFEADNFLNDYCIMQGIWGEDSSSGDVSAYVLMLDDLEIKSYYKSAAVSVRCVTDVSF